jgi:uncharacterized membrane protein YhaH (DUF805 family)
MATNFAMQFVPLLILLLLVVPAWAMIFRRAGYSGWLSLLFLVPLVNIGTFYWFAFFATWPIREKLKEAQADAFN